MSTLRLWIRCTPPDVKKIKSFLEDRNQISRDEKIYKGPGKGVMSIPTNLFPDDYTEEALSGVADVEAACSSLEGLEGPVTTHLISSSRPFLGSRTIKTIVAELLESEKGSFVETAPLPADLLMQCPNRWSLYDPMVLLPAGSFQSPEWTSILTSLGPSKQEALWQSILSAISARSGGAPFTHLAANSRIPLHNSSTPESTGENILRSPSGLVLLYGDFGPDLTGQTPSQEDFDRAFWVSTRQNRIYQTWAPRYTMFSRGNIREKARLLAFHESDKAESGRITVLGPSAALDLYAGIGYFAFSYAKMGLGKVVCWEINPWSVEGLRRGARENGWGVRVVRGAELEGDVGELLGGEENIVVFEERNERALARMMALMGLKESGQGEIFQNVLHVNCGLLPSSVGSWETAVRIVSRKTGGWIHVHENVAENDIEARRDEIETEFRRLAGLTQQRESVDVEHVELVKTFAPGVWHCVFDLNIGPVE